MNVLSEIIYQNQEYVTAVIGGGNVFVVTDDNVFRLYKNLFANISGKRIFVIKAGEDSKNITTVTEVLRAMLECGADRSTMLIAVGGGVVGDLAGFAAAVFMRGIKWINVPTTLLSQVDSSIGGKTGVDLDNYKNIVGAFHLPQQIIICAQFIKTLDKREWICGLGEVIKTAMLDKEIFNLLTDNFDKILSRDENLIYLIIKLCSQYKLGVTERDFYEKGERKNLNLGHTVGHALECEDNHLLSHGEYVLHGLKAESCFFKEDIDEGFYKAFNILINKALDGKTIKFNANEVLKAAKADKKNKEGKIVIIIAEACGKTAEKVLSDEEFLVKLSKL